MSDRRLGAILLITGAILVGVFLSKTIDGNAVDDSVDDSGFTLHNASYAGEDRPLSRECLDGHTNLVQHIHPTLRIVVDGQNVSIPADTGIGTQYCEGMHVAHTHDASGKLHVETHEPAEVELGVFFQIWDVYFAEDGIADRRIDDNHEMRMTVNGVVVDTYGEHVLADGQQIVIELVDKSD